MNKKLFAVALLAGAMTVSATAFTACTPDATPKAETFEGAVSTATYDNADKAAEGFVQQELSGTDSQAELVKYEKSKDLSDKEVADLKVSDNVDGTIKSVEKGKIYFKEQAPATFSAEATTPAASSELTASVYLIKYSKSGAAQDSYKYFAPMPEDGEALTASYFKSVFDEKKYGNCTMKMDMDMTMSFSDSSLSSQPLTIDTSTDYTICVNGNVAYMEANISIPALGILGASATEKVTSYIADTAQGTKCATAVGDKAFELTSIDAAGTGIEADKVSDIYYTQLAVAQSSFFVKTDYGFKLRDDTLNKIVNREYGKEFEGTMDFNGKYEFYVTEGKVTKQVVDVTASASDGKEAMAISITSEMLISDFGSTVVSMPADVKTLLGL